MSMDPESGMSPMINVPVDPRYKQLRVLVHTIAISLFILTGTVFVFIYREVVLVRRNTGQLSNVIAQYRRSDTEEFITRAEQRLGDFAKAYPDFTPIFNRYFGTNRPPVQPKVQPGKAGLPAE